MPTPSTHLLRTLAAVAPGTRVVEIGCGDGVHTEPLVRLGFDVWACDEQTDRVRTARARLAGVADDPEARVTTARADALGYPDAFAGWGVMTDTGTAGRVEACAEAFRVLAPGAWLWIETAAADTAALVEAARAVGFVEAEAPGVDDVRGTVHVIVRRPGPVG